MRLSVRNGAVRGLILAGVAGVAAAAWVAATWVSPEKVREQVVAALAEQFDGAEVQVEAARMRLLGGIAVTNLTLTRKGDSQPFLVVPSAVLHPDKERLNRGRLVIRKVELENPELRLERSADGRWNVAEVARDGPADRPVPTFTATGATLTVTDHSPAGLPPLHLTGGRLLVMNDPLPLLTVRAEGAAGGFGPVVVDARVNRVTRGATVRVELAKFPLGEVAGVLAERFAPAAAPHLAGFAATAAVKAELTYAADTAPAWKHDIKAELAGGRLAHPDLPWPVEGIAAKVQVTDGRVRVEGASAKVGPARVTVNVLETRRPSEAECPDAMSRAEDHLAALDFSVAGVPLDDTLFNRLGDPGAKIKRLFAPSGSVDLSYTFARDAGGWKREMEVRPKGVGLSYAKFPYPIAEVAGRVRRACTHRGDGPTEVDLFGKAAGQPVTAQGTITPVGGGPDPGIDLRIRGTNIPLDDTFVAALPEKYPDLVRQFRATGRADFAAKIAQRPGVNLCENEFVVDVRDGSINYTQFPYRLDRVQGRLVVRVAAVEPRPGDPPAPDRDELILDQFTAAHGRAAVRIHGSKRPVPGTRDRKLVLHLRGDDCAVDDDLRKALSGMKLDAVWSGLDPRGTLGFEANVEVTDRGPPAGAPDGSGPPFDPAADLKLGFNFAGPAVTPGFFPYALSDLRGFLEYQHGRVGLSHLTGRHGETTVELKAAEVRFYPDGAVWANLGRLDVKPLVADAELLAALPAKLRGPVADLNLRGRADLTVNHLVVLTPPDVPPGGPPAPAAVGPTTLRPSVGGPTVREGFPQSPPSRSGLRPAVTTATAFRPAARGQVPPPTPAAPDPVVYWDARIDLGGAAADAGITWDGLVGAVWCKGRYDATHLGPVQAHVWLGRAVVAGQPLTELNAKASVAPQQPDPARPGQYLPPAVEFRDVDGKLFHGTVGGEARVVLADPPQYQIHLTAADVQLDEVARHYKLGSDADLKGVAQGKILLYNRPDPKTGRWAAAGDGTIDVPTGRMYNLPVLLDLVKVLKLQAPDKTAFEEAHATFRIAGDRVHVDQLDLIGKALCVGGSGELGTDGEYVRFEFYTVGSQLLARLVNTPVGDLTAFLSRNLFRIRLTREDGRLKYTPEPVPVLTDPARAMLERVKKRTGKPGR